MAPRSSAGDIIKETRRKSSRSIVLNPTPVSIKNDDPMEVTKLIAHAMDALTMPFHSYNFTNSKEKKTGNAAMTKMLPFDIREPQSRSWARSDKPKVTPFEDCFTVDEMVRKSIKINLEKKTFGFRKILVKDAADKKKALSDDLTWMTYKDLDHKLDCLVQGFSSIGISSGAIVVIFMETRAEWLLAAHALYRMGVTMATLYATLGDDGIIHGMNEVKATHVITSNDLLPKIEKLSDRLNFAKTLIVVRDEIKGKRDDFILESIDNMTFVPFEELLSESFKNSSNFSRGTVVPPKPTDVAMLMYTSGSTGSPKAVIHTQESIVSGVKDLVRYFEAAGFSSRSQYICYLPLAHIMEHYASLAFLVKGCGLAFGSPYTLLASSPGLKEGSLCDAVVVEPEVMIGVPLMFDRIRKTVEAVVSSKGSLFKSTFDYVMDYKRNKNNQGQKTPIIDRIFVNKTRKLFGGKLKTIISGGAALSPDTQAFIKSCLGVEVTVIYGATETAGATIMYKGDKSLSTAGIPFDSNIIKLVNWEEGGYRVTDQPFPRGEVIIGSKAVATGYYMNEEATKESFRVDENGITWWSSGDIGEILSDGSLKIVDRKKDLLKLSFGEYISLGKVEAHLKSSPIVDNICVYGSGKKDFLIAFVVPNPVVLKEMAKKLGRAGTDVSDSTIFENLCLDEEINSAAFQQIKSYGVKSGLLRYEVPTKIKLCHEQWTPDSGLVTAALKIRRRPIQDFYQSDIDRMMS